MGCVRRVLQAEGWPARSWQQDGLLVEDEGGRRLRGGGGDDEAKARLEAAMRKAEAEVGSGATPGGGAAGSEASETSERAGTSGTRDETTGDDGSAAARVARATFERLRRNVAWDEGREESDGRPARGSVAWARLGRGAVAAAAWRAPFPTRPTHGQLPGQEFSSFAPT